MMKPNINDDFRGWIEATAGLHDGNGWDVLVDTLAMREQQPDDPFRKFTIEGAAKKFGVHRHTMTDWISRFDRYNEAHATDTHTGTVQ